MPLLHFDSGCSEINRALPVAERCDPLNTQIGTSFEQRFGLLSQIFGLPQFDEHSLGRSDVCQALPRFHRGSSILIRANAEAFSGHAPTLTRGASFSIQFRWTDAAEHVVFEGSGLRLAEVPFSGVVTVDGFVPFAGLFPDDAWVRPCSLSRRLDIRVSPRTFNVCRPDDLARSFGGSAKTGPWSVVICGPMKWGIVP